MAMLTAETFTAAGSVVPPIDYPSASGLDHVGTWLVTTASSGTAYDAPFTLPANHRIIDVQFKCVDAVTLSVSNGKIGLGVSSTPAGYAVSIAATSSVIAAGTETTSFVTAPTIRGSTSAATPRITALDNTSAAGPTFSGTYRIEVRIVFKTYGNLP